MYVLKLKSIERYLLMKKELKKVLSLLIVVTILMGMSIMSFAAEGSDSEDCKPHIYGVDVLDSGEPGMIGGMSRVVADCYNGPHDLVGRGWGDIVNVDTGKTVVSMGACSQCTKCNLVVITQGEPGTGSALGYYTSWQPNEPLTSYMTVVRQSGSNIHYTSDSTLPGAKFRY